MKIKNLFYASLIILVINVVVGALPAFALTVSPVSLEITGDPGITVTGELKLYNEQEGTRTFYSSFETSNLAGILARQTLSAQMAI